MRKRNLYVLPTWYSFLILEVCEDLIEMSGSELDRALIVLKEFAVKFTVNDQFLIFIFQHDVCFHSRKKAKATLCRMFGILMPFYLRGGYAIAYLFAF